MEDDIFNKYKAELEQDVIIDDFNIKDVQLQLPGRKHKWIARLIQHKQEIQKLQQIREEKINNGITAIKESGGLNLSDRTLRQKIELTEEIIKIDEFIKKHGIIIEYLEKVEKIFSNITYDIKNLIEIRKLELL